MHFHEDDFSQIEILPAQNWDYCAAQIAEISEFAEKHKDPDGLGWSDVYLRREEPISLSSLSLNSEAVSAALAKHLEPFTHVETGYSSHRESCTNTKGFGFDASCVVFLSRDEASVIRNIWLGLGGPNELQQKALLSAFESLEAFGQLIYVDWAWGSLFYLTDHEDLVAYLRSRQKHLATIGEELRKNSASAQGSKKKPWWRFFG